MIHVPRFVVLSAVILVGLWGCDNVTWGGADLSLQAPPPPPGAEADPQPVEEIETLPRLPEGPVLFVVRREGGEARLAPVGEISGDSLAPFPTEAELPGFTARYVSERLVKDREFTLLSDGARVGRFIAGERVEPDSFYCQARPSVTGVIEVVPEAAELESFLALPVEASGHIAHAEVETVTSTREQRVASLRIMGGLLNETGARWPPDLVATRADLRLFSLGAAGEPAMAATFLYRDRLGVGAAQASAYSIFFLAESAGAGYQPAFWSYRPVDPQGKGAARYMARADWDGDGQQEILLDVYGAESRWLAAIDRAAGGWRLAFQDPCGAPAPAR